jgi:hypothetical protein
MLLTAGAAATVNNDQQQVAASRRAMREILDCQAYRLLPKKKWARR